jgi:Arc/MetJ family transcription regulator
MRTTLNIDDELLQQAQALSGVQEKTAWCAKASRP